MEQLVICRSDNNMFTNMQQAMSGNTIFDKLAAKFELIFDFKATCATVPNLSYTENMELRVLAHDMVIENFPGPDQCRSIQQYGSDKFRL